MSAPVTITETTYAVIYRSDDPAIVEQGYGRKFRTERAARRRLRALNRTTTQQWQIVRVDTVQTITPLLGVDSEDMEEAGL